MEVEIRYGVCNNSPAESTSPENGWSLSAQSTPGCQGKCQAPMSRSARRVGRRQAWHAIIAFGKQIRLDDVERGMPSSPLD